LTEEQLSKLGQIIEDGPVAVGYQSGVWTGPMIGDLIERMFGVRYHNHYVPRLLNHLGFSVQRPRKRLARNQHNHELEFISNVKSYLAGHAAESVTVEQLVEEFRVSRSQLGRLFKEHLGCGVIEYFHRVKIEYAKELIRESSLNFSEIALRLGFGSVHYFSRMFKRSTGMTPSEYAQRQNELRREHGLRHPRQPGT
jgi:transcriptional regulator GlxA family with amidase domain